MSATVTDPLGVVHTGVDGALLDYYRAEALVVPGYVITDDPADGPVQFPVMFSTPDTPAKSALKQDWVDYGLAVDPDLTVDAANAMTIPELIEAYADVEATVPVDPDNADEPIADEPVAETQDSPPES